jgi:receptor expression-enhancing protein 5/6
MWPARILCHFFVRAFPPRRAAAAAAAALGAQAFLYPAYQSFKAVRESNPEKHAQWLTYWIVNSYFTVFELFGDSLLSWIPFYHELKVALLIWLVTPRFNGAEKIYKQVIHPYLVHYEKDIDQSLSTIREQGADKLDVIRDAGVRHLRTSSSEVLRMGQSVVLTGLLQSAKDDLTRKMHSGSLQE